MDGVPENLALGISLGEGTVGLALLPAIFVSSFPESLVSSASMRAQGRSLRNILGLWIACAVLLTAAANPPTHPRCTDRLRFGRLPARRFRRPGGSLAFHVQ